MKLKKHNGDYYNWRGEGNSEFLIHFITTVVEPGSVVLNEILAIERKLPLGLMEEGDLGGGGGGGGGGGRVPQRL